ncbi:hypothetical protein NLX86_05845 [Streptomyces sp. A3M-1-3]|uniref:hypothetical protein n=1 Tax=Streptomyces sp. A3M-1-3 TaxID=2962044 RepID=UPI0020B65383|nr:hypothetical protein [Streptomyces sp. A3M-1-3]MCP3817673.1 hypothetical protein [Streptomyces sp. A3M-1-3]
MNPHRKIRSTRAVPPVSRNPRIATLVAAVLLIPLIAVVGSDDFRLALDFTTGVLSLVSLTASVAWGLLATDRLLLSPRHRLVAQGIHRTTAIASLGFLLLHASVKVSLGHASLLGALIPFGLGLTGTAGLIGLGSLAGYLMVVAATTGALRRAFATPGRIAGRWRAFHMLAYPAWCAALMHGMYAGRPAATWVVVMYSLCLAGVVGVVAVRLLPAPVQRDLADRVTALVKPGNVPAEAPLQPITPQPMAPRAERAERAAMPPLQRMPAPMPPLYEAPPRPPARLTAGADTGISAAYRAVSASAGTGQIPRTESTGQIPLAERIPMTEELPVVPPAPDYAPRSQPGGRWPAPSPPPPAPVRAPDETEPLPGPFQPPPAGEPWHAPAGERP